MIDATLVNANILIIDDQQANIDVLCGLLELEGYSHYMSATDPRKAITLYDEFKPDILLLDLNMPILNGFQIMKQLSNLIPANTYFPILVLTADITAESKLMALAAGAADFITKPFDLIEVDLRIKNLLKVGYLHQLLADQNQLLEEKVKERTAELVKTNSDLILAKEKAEEMSRLKSSFLANMSHELRTPLIGINGFADFLRQDIADPELKEMAEIIFDSGNRLSETVNLILDLSKFESEKMELSYQPIDLVRGTQEILNLFKESARKKRLELRASYSSSSIIINTDGWAFRSILNNLINNAIKYTEQGIISIDIALNDSFAEIKVADTGIGISKEHHKIIFEAFRQVSEGLNRNFEGTGLGLNITKNLVEKLGGEIFVESEIGTGSTFIVKLPIADNVKLREKEIVPVIEFPLMTGKKPVALLIDDDPFVYPVLKRYINDRINLESITEGKSAIELCKKRQFDYIFMDINLKCGIDGKQVTQVIRKIKGYESIPVIATSAYAMAGDKEEFLAAGCSHYLSKPFRQEDITNLLHLIFSHKEENVPVH
jgi:signal transduction histidine kinase